MTYYVKSDPAYDKVTYDRGKVRTSAARLKKARKQPTSVALDPAMIRELRRHALQRGIPYQVLMRMFIVEGLRNLKKAS
jgi:type III secretion system FlhB-like substrate exporter